MTLADQWNSYRKNVLPANASAVQVRECKRAFYGGAFSFYSLVMGGLEDGEEATDVDIEFMESLSEELMEFYRRVRGGLE